jgi:hypothetical protein
MKPPRFLEEHSLLIFTIMPQQLLEQERQGKKCLWETICSPQTAPQVSIHVEKGSL